MSANWRPGCMLWGRTPRARIAHCFERCDDCLGVGWTSKPSARPGPFGKVCDIEPCKGCGGGYYGYTEELSPGYGFNVLCGKIFYEPDRIVEDENTTRCEKCLAVLGW